jgi:hypothetical protein
VEAALAKAVSQLEGRKQALDNVTPLSQTTSASDFTKFEELVAAFAACPARAGQRLGPVDNALSEGEESLRNWLARAEAARRKLAACAGGVPQAGEP